MRSHAGKRRPGQESERDRSPTSLAEAIHQLLCSLKTHRLPPWGISLTILATSPPHSGTAPPQPETTAMNCSLSCSHVTGEPITPEPVWNFHSSSPVLASKALRYPADVPVNTRLLAVASTP